VHAHNRVPRWKHPLKLKPSLLGESQLLRLLATRRVQTCYCLLHHLLSLSPVRSNTYSSVTRAAQLSTGSTRRACKMYVYRGGEEKEGAVDV
jgi:hypothetical protein